MLEEVQIIKESFDIVVYKGEIIKMQVDQIWVDEQKKQLDV